MGKSGDWITEGERGGTGASLEKDAELKRLGAGAKPLAVLGHLTQAGAAI